MIKRGEVQVFQFKFKAKSFSGNRELYECTYDFIVLKKKEKKIFT